MDNIDDVVGLEDDDIGIPNEDEFTYDIEADDDDNVLLNNMEMDINNTMGQPNQPMHIKRRSISDMVNAELESEMLDNEDMNILEHESDDEAFKTAMGDEHNWMETAKKWMMKEKQLKEQIMDLEDDLANTDQTMRDMEIDHEKRLPRYEEEKNELVEQYEEQIEAIQSEQTAITEKLSNDNVTLARDVDVLRHEVSEQKRQIDDYEAEIKEIRSVLEMREIEWKAHSEICPLLNHEIAKEIEQKRNEEIKKYKLGSQQMDASLGKMLTENKQMEDEIVSLKEDINSKDEQIEQRNVEIDKLRKNLDVVKASDNKNKGALAELRLREEDERNKRQELETEYQKLGNEFDMLMAYSNEQAQVIDAAEFAPTGDCLSVLRDIIHTIVSIQALMRRDLRQSKVKNLCSKADAVDLAVLCNQWVASLSLPIT